ncbi:MAG: hypothetical protein NC251_00730 [Lachnoclostridium sp.]|nr:hypothetical protein [Lachnospira sp.]MCM1246943.1 hypothetical protein [Lachnoclostridium sp.]
MNNRLFVLCDREEEYACLMTEFLKRHKELPWEIHTYTDRERMMQEEKEEIALLVVAESAYAEEIQHLRPLRMVILNESGLKGKDDVRNINKYQQAENVLRELLEVYTEIVGEQPPWLTTRYKTKFVGIYSPVRRCLQTSFALTLSQMLAQEHRTLYLNFEHYAGITELLPDIQTRDLADMLYFLTAEGQKFKLRFQTMVQQKGKLDYIPPMKSGQNLLSVMPAEWMGLFQKIEEIGEYEYVILDLSESMQGLFDILRMCVRVYTLTKDDRIAQSKLMQYEQILALYEYGDVLEKTCKCSPPTIKRLPAELEQYTKGELADYVRAQCEEI